LPPNCLVRSANGERIVHASPPTEGRKDTWEKCLKGLICLHPIFPLCYAEAAMDTAKSHRPLKPRLCRSPQLTPARLAACRANARKSTGPRTARGKARSSLNALKHGRYAHRLTHTLEQAGERQQLHLYWEILSRISRHFQVDWPREQRTAERLARQVWCSGWKALEQVKRTEDLIENTGSWKNNMRVRIWIEGNARGRALRFVFGPRRRRRLTARVIPLGSLAELSALWRRVFCLVSGLSGEAASWDTQLPPFNPPPRGGDESWVFR